MIKGVFPSFSRFAYLCIVAGIVISMMSLLEFYSYRSEFGSGVKEAKGRNPEPFLPIREVAVGAFFYGLAAIVGGIGLILHRKWARIVLLVLGWILMFYAVGFGIYFQFLIGRMSQGFAGVMIFIRALSILFVLIFMYAIYSLISYIRRNRV